MLVKKGSLQTLNISSNRDNPLTFHSKEFVYEVEGFKL